jgi:predicted metal-binding membrane protein
VRPNGRPRWSPASLQELAFVGVLPAIATAAWVSTILGMAGMAARLWSYPADLGLYIGTWIAMTTAMMLPSITPTVIVYERAVRSHRGRRAALALSVAFVGGYLAVWGVAGLVPYALLRVGAALDSGLLIGGAGRYLAAAVLVAAAVYQLAPPKHACLRRFRALPGCVRNICHSGGIGALRWGLESGGWCLGCSWALMASLVALGVMSLTWMILTWTLVMAERLLPSRRLATVGVAFILAALAIGVAVGAPISPVPAHGSAPM